MNDPRIHISISAASPAEAHSMLAQLLNGAPRKHFVGECVDANPAPEEKPAEPAKQTRKSTPKKETAKQEKKPEPESEAQDDSADDTATEDTGEDYTRADLKDVIKEIHGKGGDAILTQVQKILKSTANAGKQSEVADEHVGAVVVELKALLETL